MENKVVRLKYIRKHFLVPIVTTSHDPVIVSQAIQAREEQSRGQY